MRPRRTGPLRKIVDRVPHTIAPGVEVLYERLECGHEQRVVQDIYGDTFAVRRRCRQCQKMGAAK